MAKALTRRFVTLTRRASGKPVVIGLDHIIAVYDADPVGATKIILVGEHLVTVEGTVEDIRTRLGR
ncbi:MAG: hypothetical protein GY708_25920 [Actinomycetia bacterium]|nr:hypothetical protein [Actinomycetes bacterium]